MISKLTALVCTLALVGLARADDATLPAFSSIRVCTPFNVQIAPSSGNAYGYSVSGDSALSSVVVADVASGVLSLSSQGTLNTQQPIKVIVRLPASKLAGVTVSSAVGITVIVSKGFSPSDLTAINQGSGALAITGLTANGVKLVNSGTGTLGFVGTASAASVEATGTGATYVSGITKSVQVEADGTSRVLINSQSSNLQIMGTADGISSVSYNKGQCSVQSSGLGKACIQSSSIKPPVIRAYWTCGLQLSGSWDCSTSGGSQSSSSSSGGGNSFSSSSSSSSGGGNSFMSSSSSNNGGVNTNSISSGGSGGTTITTNTGKLTTQACKVGTGAIKMSK